MAETRVLNGSEILIECLKEQGVKTVFGYPGGAILNIYDALYKLSLIHILRQQTFFSGTQCIFFAKHFAL